MKKIDKLTKLLNIDDLKLEKKDKVVEKTTDLVKTIDDKVENLEKINLEQSDLVNFKNLKTDYLLIRQNLIKLINLGQNFLSGVSGIDIYELKSTQISAISDVYNAITSSLKTLMDIYKQIADIDLKYKNQNKSEEKSITNIQNQDVKQIVFTGTSSELLEIIKNAK